MLLPLQALAAAAARLALKKEKDKERVTKESTGAKDKNERVTEKERGNCC
jgi:hypothetical protein